MHDSQGPGGLVEKSHDRIIDGKHDHGQEDYLTGGPKNGSWD